tara:strand:+ start:116 stop:325 length:210 start_codon:yes stop_codon:yes gene_type:complete
MKQKLYQLKDLVKWYDYYDDHIVRDAGLGVVIDKRAYGDMDSLVTYHVYKFKSQQCEWYTHHELETPLK